MPAAQLGVTHLDALDEGGGVRLRVAVVGRVEGGLEHARVPRRMQVSALPVARRVDVVTTDLVVLPRGSRSGNDSCA
jgi:hypothetical protein